MALTVTSRGTGTHNTGATTLVPGGRNATFAVGSLGVLCIALDNAGSAGSTLIAPDSWTDAKGNVWTLRRNRLYDNGAASAGIEMAFYTAPIVTQLLTTDAGTMTWKTGVSPVAKAWTWYEVIPSNGITPEYLNSGDIAGATAANAQVVTAESINVGDAVIAGYFSENVAAVTQDSDSTNGSWTAQQTATVGTTTSGVRIATQQKVQTTAASTQSYDVTVNSQDRIAGYISIRDVTAQTPQPTAASLTATGSAPTVTVTDNKAVAPSAASLTVTGATPTVTVSANQLAVPDAVALTTTVAVPVIGDAVIPTAAGLATSMSTPVIDSAAIPTAAEITVIGDTPSVLTPVASSPDPASLTLTLETPDVLTPVATDPAAASLVLTGAVPVVQSGAAVQVTPDAASVSLTGASPTVTVTDNVRVLPTAAGLVAAGAIPPVEAGASWVIIPVARGLTITMAVPFVSTASTDPPPYNADERLPFPRQAVPKAAQLGVVGAQPRVRIGDDMDVLMILLS